MIRPGFAILAPPELNLSPPKYFDREKKSLITSIHHILVPLWRAKESRSAKSNKIFVPFVKKKKHVGCQIYHSKSLLSDGEQNPIKTILSLKFCSRQL